MKSIVPMLRKGNSWFASTIDIYTVINLSVNERYSFGTLEAKNSEDNLP
jgi:hypothetical protein